MPWFDGGYAAGQQITTSDGISCILLVSLGTLGWVAQELQSKKKIIVMFDTPEEPPC
jgi:hypothetical protein